MGRADAFHRRVTRQGPRGAGDRLLLSLLIPFGYLYGLTGKLRATLYRRGLLPSRDAGVPVVSVGNLSAGGTGKTPTVDAIVKFYLSLGKRVAVVSRGYGGRQRHGVGAVSLGQGPLLPPEACGDEPFLLSLRNPAALVFVAPRRIEGVQAAKAQGAEVVVLDDGFQHLGLRRELDIVLIDARRPLGNGFPLPAGNLREFPSALKRSDMLILTRSSGGEKLPSSISSLCPVILHSRHVLGERAISLSGEGTPLDRLAGKRGIAFAGIAHPGNFFEDLAEKGLRVEKTFSFPDHEPYSADRLRLLAEAAQNADYLITTEKDGVKLRGMEFPVPCYQVPLEVEFLERGELEKRLSSIQELR